MGHGIQPNNKEIKMKCNNSSHSAMLSVVLLSLLSGCATQSQTLYSWGSYQNEVYARLKASTTPEQQIHNLEKTLQDPKIKQPVAPGYHAHLGLLYGEVGRLGDMREQFILEKQLFPESTVFMDFLLSKADVKQGNKK
jgi:hypothetical protein